MSRAKFDPSEYDWWCDGCGASLNNQSGFDPECGTWVCTECGYENEIAASETEDSYRYGYSSCDVEDEEEEVPEGCAACGGPYPDCKSSCKLFDDDD